MPSSDITPRKKLFYQQQFNIDEGFVQLNTTFSYGLGKSMEIGLNVIGLNVNTHSSCPTFLTNSNPMMNPLYPFYTINFQKAFQLSPVFKLAAGTQTGYSAGLHVGSYIYSNLVSILPGFKTKIITGLYWGSDSFLGPEARSSLLPSGSGIGTQIGLEQPVFNERLYLIAENISGRHSLGETSLGAAWRFTPRWMWSMAYQFPNPNGLSSKALVLELTFVP